MLALVVVLIALAAFMMWGKEKDNLWVEVEAWGVPKLLEGLCRLRGAVMKAAAVVGAPRCFWFVCDPVLRAARGGRDVCLVPC